MTPEYIRKYLRYIRYLHWYKLVSYRCTTSYATVGFVFWNDKEMCIDASLSLTKEDIDDSANFIWKSNITLDAFRGNYRAFKA